MTDFCDADDVRIEKPKLRAQYWWGATFKAKETLASHVNFCIAPLKMRALCGGQVGLTPNVGPRLTRRSELS